MSKTRSKPSLIPEFVSARVPDSLLEAKEMQYELSRKYLRLLGSFPERCDLNPKVVSRRRLSWFSGYTECHVTYESQPGDVVPAYLLVPNVGTPPFPAIVAQHQCFVDCDVGKDAVVGKAYLRPDQAYGFELVNQGFVVLAPDSINCGERNIRGLREEGQRDKSKCWGAAFPYVQSLGFRSFYAKHIYDAMRAVDYLETLDFVDRHRIGMIGHSLGAGTTFWTTAMDSRIRCGVASCHFLGGLNSNGWGLFYRRKDEQGLYFHELLQLIPPRGFLMVLGANDKPFPEQGDFDTAEDRNAVIRWAFEGAKNICRLYQAPPRRIELRLPNYGHRFSKKQRQYAYRWLARHLS